MVNVMGQRRSASVLKQDMKFSTRLVLVHADRGGLQRAPEANTAVLTRNGSCGWNLNVFLFLPDL